jgi:hypothetical protein
VEAQEQAAAKGEIFVGVAPGIRDRAKYNEFIVAQVKVSFTSGGFGRMHIKSTVTVPDRIRGRNRFDLPDDVVFGVRFASIYARA